MSSFTTYAAARLQLTVQFKKSDKLVLRFQKCKIALCNHAMQRASKSRWYLAENLPFPHVSASGQQKEQHVRSALLSADK